MSREVEKSRRVLKRWQRHTHQRRLHNHSVTFIPSSFKSQRLNQAVVKKNHKSYRLQHLLIKMRNLLQVSLKNDHHKSSRQPWVLWRVTMTKKNWRMSVLLRHMSQQLSIRRGKLRRGSLIKNTHRSSPMRHKLYLINYRSMRKRL